jgi:hypothetical protein
VQYYYYYVKISFYSFQKYEIISESERKSNNTGSISFA